MILAFIFNVAALVTVILWILHIGAKSTAKLLKIIAIILLAIAGKNNYFCALFATTDIKMVLTLPTLFSLLLNIDAIIIP